MGSGPFRDTSAAIERAETLERENAELLAEIERLRQGASASEEARAYDDTVRRLTRERDALKLELDKMRYSAPAVLDSATRKLREERDAIARELHALRERVPPSDDNRGAVLQRVTEERDELLARVRELEEQLASATRRKR
ncbi:MAG: hypothetical protein JST00_12500 [Deltaproteobacteria bacterium]|nr:hypothetical protein [Deltaproteobacteria bacterium]